MCDVIMNGEWCLTFLGFPFLRRFSARSLGLFHVAVVVNTAISQLSYALKTYFLKLQASVHSIIIQPHMYTWGDEF